MTMFDFLALLGEEKFDAMAIDDFLATYAPGSKYLDFIFDADQRTVREHELRPPKD
jgi:hypothetical protein